MTILPHRFRETSFRRYEPYIRQIVVAFPQPIIFDPSPLSPVTFSCRLRDAMTSLSRYDWQTDVNKPKFQQIHPHLSICEYDGKIIARSRKSADIKTLQPPTDGTLTLDTPTDELLQETAVKLHNRSLQGPVRVKGLPLSKVQALATKFDIEVAVDGDNILIL